MSKRNRDGEIINKCTDNFFNLSFNKSYSNVLKFVETYVREFLFTHHLFNTFIRTIKNSNFVVVDSLNVSLWSDYYNVVNAFINSHKHQLPQNVQSYVDHCTLFKSLSLNQKK